LKEKNTKKKERKTATFKNNPSSPTPVIFQMVFASFPVDVTQIPEQV
jgi:hypothetical protein